MVKEQLEMYRAYQRTIQTLFTICGCWYMPTESGKSRYYWSICMILGMIIYMTIGMNTSYVFRHNLVHFMKSLSIMIAGISAIIKVGAFLFNRSSLINYHRTLNELFEEELARNEKIRTIMLSSLPAIRTQSYIYITIMMLMVMAYMIPPYLFIIRDLCHFRLTTNYTIPISRGYGYFWTLPDNFLYHVHLLLETTLVLLASLTASIVDSTFGFYVYQFASTMHAMTFRLMNPLPTEKFSDILKTCVKKHQKLLQCRDTLEFIYGRIVLWHMITNAMILCALIYEFLDFGMSNFFVFMTYSLVKLLQTLIFAWNGSILTSASEDFHKGIYFSEWYNSDVDRHVKANIILIIMQKPMVLNALFFPINAVLFKNFVNTSMSYLCLLRSVNGKD